MTKLDYTNYLKDKYFKIDEEYYNSFLIKNKFQKPSENIEQRFRRYKNKNYFFKKVFFQIKLEDILLSKHDLIDLIKKIEFKISKLSKKNQKIFKLQVKKVFNYSDKFQSKTITPFFTDNFNFRVCFYCNKDFITNFETDKKVSTFQLDHFYDKGTYPYLALSFYNLIPSCYVCNAKGKGSANTFQVSIPPNDENFDFENKIKFKLFLDEDCKNLHVQDKEHIDIPLKEQFTNEYDKYIEIFKLNERYKAHKDIVYEMITKAELYPQSRLKELQDLTGIPFQQIKKDIFSLSDEKDLSKKPFSKLIKDMSEELKLT